MGAHTKVWLIGAIVMHTSLHMMIFVIPAVQSLVQQYFKMSFFQYNLLIGMRFVAGVCL